MLAVKTKGRQMMTAFTFLGQTDITGVTSAVSGYVTAGIAVGVAVLLFALGRKVIKRVV